MNLTGVDVGWVKDQLANFVSRTRPVNQSGNGFITTRTSPECGRAEAIQLTETVRPILDRLYPEWRSENAGSTNNEFKSERDGSQRLLARLESHEEVSKRLGGMDGSPNVTTRGMHPLIWSAAQAQWSTGHRHEAVLAAAKAVNSHLQAKLDRRDISESDLIRQALSKDDPQPRKARLRFTAIADEQTRESVRQGVMNFGAGCFGAIRNPVGHLPNDELDLPDQVAVEQLAALSLLARWLDDADVMTTSEDA
jgi:hypothetical protein